MNALKALSSKAALAASFKRLQEKTKKKNWSVAGTDGISIAIFHRDQDIQLAKLSLDLKSRKFSFSTLRPVFVRKPGPIKRFRLICVPTVTDRVVQGVLHERMSRGDPCRLNNGVSYGFIKGKGVTKAVIRAKELRTQHPYAYKTDITSFFDTIQRTTLKEVITRRVKERSLHPLLCAAVDCEVIATGGWEERQIKDIGIKPGIGARQGMPLSPFFANLLLSDFDKAMEANGFSMLRYADDLVFFCDSEEECKKIHYACGSALNLLGLSIPDISPGSKTQIYQPDQAAEFLGVELVKSGSGYRLEISNDQTEAVHEIIMRYADGAALLERGITFTRYGRSLENTIAGYRSAYSHCDNFDKFDKKLTAWKRTATERLLKKWLRVPLDQLSAPQKKFLELLGSTSDE